MRKQQTKKLQKQRAKVSYAEFASDDSDPDMSPSKSDTPFQKRNRQCRFVLIMTHDDPILMHLQSRSCAGSKSWQLAEIGPYVEMNRTKQDGTNGLP
jgi:hypothetical protein